MSIVINADLEYLKSKLNIPEARMATYQAKTVDEILKAEAAAGNQEAIKLAADMFTNVSQLIELFQLADPQNKLVIMQQMNSSQLEKLVPMLEQDDLLQGAEPTPAPKIFKDTCHLDWTSKAVSVHNLVRGLSPYPAAWTEFFDGDSEPLTAKIFETATIEYSGCLTPGKVTIESGRMYVDCADARIEILSLQVAGKKRMPVADFLRGSRFGSSVFVR